MQYTKLRMLHMTLSNAIKLAHSAFEFFLTKRIFRLVYAVVCLFSLCDDLKYKLVFADCVFICDFKYEYTSLNC